MNQSQNNKENQTEGVQSVKDVVHPPAEILGEQQSNSGGPNHPSALQTSAKDIALKKENAAYISKLQEVFDQEPTKVSEAVVSIWKQVGPINVSQLVSEGVLEFDGTKMIKVNIKDSKHEIYRSGQVFDGNHKTEGIARTEKVEDDFLLEGFLVQGQAHHGYVRIINPSGVLCDHFNFGTPNGG